jgi:multidrug efflux pump subunit AcrA (membrane-fusion protein)
MNASQPRRAEVPGGAAERPGPAGRAGVSAAFAVDPVRELAALLQLGRRAREALSAPALGFVMVNETRQLFGYRQAAFARPNQLSQRLPAEVLAVSGLPQPDTQAPYVQWLAQVFRDIPGRDTPGQPGSAFVLKADALPDLVAREWSAWLPLHALLLPLPGPGAEVLGFLLFARDEAWSERDVALAGELGSLYGFALLRFFRTAAWRDRSRVIGWAGRHRWKLAAALALICLMPVRLTALAPAEVVPSEPFLVRAPLEGVIDHFDVRPNQTVAVGDPLFDLDTTTLRAHSSVAHKAYDVASEEYRQAAQGAVTDERRKLEMVERKGELEQKALEMQYSEQLLERVLVKAARAGVAVFADANDWQGRAVSIGERVLTLADPARVELTVYLPVRDVMDLEVGSPITLYPNGSAFETYPATLKTLAYRAEPTHDGLLAYRIKATFDGRTAAPRIGLQGMAKLRAGRVPLVYALLRRPIAAARQWLGW